MVNLVPSVFLIALLAIFRLVNRMKLPLDKDDSHDQSITLMTDR